MQTKPIPADLLEQILSEPFQERFWLNVDLRGQNECWRWMASCTTRYANFTIWSYKRHIVRKVHKIAWIIYHRKDVPPGAYVLHSCVGNPLCCNPHHLRTGTQQDNIDDMMSQGRHGFYGVYGEAHPSSKLSNCQVIAIRKEYGIGKATLQKLADDFGVGRTTIEQIVKRVTWKHI